MNLSLAFWGAWDATDTDAETDVRRQAMEWADAEPNVMACEVVAISRPHPDRMRWYRVDVLLTMKGSHP